jgi:predicted Fe-Mo cluster-binding NifX family protein
MRIAIPVIEGQLCAHFGHCQEFAIIDADPETKQILANETAIPPAHEPGVLPSWLHEKGVNAIISGGMGQRAQMFFTQYGINVLTGATGGTPEEVVLAYLNDQLILGSNICDH